MLASFLVLLRTEYIFLFIIHRLVWGKHNLFSVRYELHLYTRCTFNFILPGLDKPSFLYGLHRFQWHATVNWKRWRKPWGPILSTILSWPRKTTKIISDDWELGPRRLECEAGRLAAATLDIRVQTVVSPRLVLPIKFQITGGTYNALFCRGNTFLFRTVEHTDSDEQCACHNIPFHTAVSTKTVRQ
jgi:hypothetical protein